MRDSNIDCKYFFLYEIIKIKFKFDKLSLFLLSFIIYVTIRSITFDGGFEIRNTALYFRFLLFSYALFYFNKKYNLNKNLFKIFIITFIVLILDGIFQFFLDLIYLALN